GRPRRGTRAADARRRRADRTHARPRPGGATVGHRGRRGAGRDPGAAEAAARRPDRTPRDTLEAARGGRRRGDRRGRGDRGGREEPEAPPGPRRSGAARVDGGRGGAQPELVAAAVLALVSVGFGGGAEGDALAGERDLNVLARLEDAPLDGCKRHLE